MTEPVLDLRYAGPPFNETDFDRLDRRLQCVETKIIYIGVPDPDIGGNRRIWNLAGNYGGAEGLDLAPKAGGLMMMPFTQKYSEGAYQIGATLERTDYERREINIGVMVGNSYKPDTSFRYRMLEQRWWASWSETEEGWLGVFTRTHGWRFLRVRLAEEPKNEFELDPVAFENNFMQWDFTCVATQPFWCKRIEQATWKNPGDLYTAYTPNMGYDDLFRDLVYGEGTLTLPNRGTRSAYPKFMIQGEGVAWVQDGIGGEMMPLPTIHPADGMVLLDTDPTARTLTAAKDPVDPFFYKIARNSQILDFVLHDLLESGLPIWRRFDAKGFMASIPPRTVANLKVRHTNPNGVITAYMPQRFTMAYGQ